MSQRLSALADGKQQAMKRLKASQVQLSKMQSRVESESASIRVIDNDILNELENLRQASSVDHESDSSLVSSMPTPLFFPFATMGAAEDTPNGIAKDMVAEENDDDEELVGPETYSQRNMQRFVKEQQGGIQYFYKTQARRRKVLKCPMDSDGRYYVTDSQVILYDIPKAAIKGCTSAEGTQVFRIVKVGGTYLADKHLGLPAKQTRFEDPRDAAEVYRKLQHLYHNWRMTV
jgi:hypothetical protein